MTQDEPLTILRRTLGGYARHVNFSAVVVLGLGCEVNQIGGLMKEQKLAGRLRELKFRKSAVPAKTVEPVSPCAASADRCQQRQARTGLGQRIDVALQCGGSDGYSGVSANPALGLPAIFWCAMAALSFCRRRRRPTAPSIC